MYKLEQVAISRLKEYENNPRNNEIAIDKIAASIKRLGFLFPIVIDINYVIICGHTRKKACERLGIKSAPCIRVDDLTPEQVCYFRLVDNRTSEYSSWDFSRLEEELKRIDLSSVATSLLLETFDFEVDRAEIDTAMTEIKVETFNFLAPKGNHAAVPSGGIDDADDDEIYTDTPSENIASGMKPETNTNPQILENEGEAKPISSPLVLMFEVGLIRFFYFKNRIRNVELRIFEIHERSLPG